MGKRSLDFSPPPSDMLPITIEPQAAPPPRTADSLADRLGREEVEYQKVAESIFDRPQDSWTPGDWAILRRVGPRPGGSPAHDRNAWNAWIAKQAGRLSTVRQQQQAAGTPGDREQARQLEEATAAAVATDAPEIEAELARLQSRLATLVTEAKRAQDAVARQEAAVVALQDDNRLPTWILDEIHAAQRRHVAEFRNELAQCRGRLAGIESVLSLDPESAPGVAQIELHVGGLAQYGDSVARVSHFFEVSRAGLGPSQNSAVTARRLKLLAWREYCRTLATEAELFKPRIAELGLRERAAAEELAAMRRFYVPA